jgi:hypothetical protein
MYEADEFRITELEEVALWLSRSTVIITIA